MINAPIPKNEKERLSTLHSLNILDTGVEKRFDKITKDAAEKLDMPMSTISIIDKDREWYKSRVGVEAEEGGRDVSFCGHAVFWSGIFIIEDTLLDDRFKDNPYVIGEPFVRFYAGVSLREKETNTPIAVFCVKDTKPRSLSLKEINLVLEYAKQAEVELNKE